MFPVMKSENIHVARRKGSIPGGERHDGGLRVEECDEKGFVDD